MSRTPPPAPTFNAQVSLCPLAPDGSAAPLRCMVTFGGKDPLEFWASVFYHARFYLDVHPEVRHVHIRAVACCATCGGEGKVYRRRRGIASLFSKPCPECGEWPEPGIVAVLCDRKIGREELHERLAPL